MQQMTYTCDICKQRIPTGTLVLNGIAVSLPYTGKLHNLRLKVLNQDLDVCQACADKIEAKIAALEIAEVGHLRFDNLRFMLHFPAFDLKFTSRSNPQLHGYRNVIDVAELDVLLQWYKERKESYGR